LLPLDFCLAVALRVGPRVVFEAVAFEAGFANCLRVSSMPRAIRLIISCAVKLVTIGPQDSLPSPIVADHKGLTGLTFCNEHTAFICIVIDIGDVCDWKVELLKVFQAGGITANNDVLWYPMPALGNSPCNTLQRFLC